MAALRRGALARGPSRKPNRKQRFYSATFPKLIEQGGLLEKGDLERYLIQTGNAEFPKSWPRLSPRFVRIEEDGEAELVMLTVAALAQVDRARAFLRRFIQGLQIAIDHYQGTGKPVISVKTLVAELPGLEERQAMCLMRVLECEGLLKRADPKAPCGVLTGKLARFTGVENRDDYLREKRRTERGRGRRRAGAFLRRLWSRTMGADSNLWVRLASGAGMLLIAFVLGLAGGLFEEAGGGKEGAKSPPPRADTGRLPP